MPILLSLRPTAPGVCPCCCLKDLPGPVTATVHGRDDAGRSPVCIRSRANLATATGYGRAVSGLVWAQAFAWRSTVRMARGIARRTTGERASPMPKRSPAMLRTTAWGARS